MVLRGEVVPVCALETYTGEWRYIKSLILNLSGHVGHTVPAFQIYVWGTCPWVTFVTTQLVSHIHSIRVHSRLPKATHSKPSCSHHDQSQVGTQQPITVMASARGTRSENKRTVLAWCVSRRVDPSAVPFDQSQSINKSKCRTTQYCAATTNQCFTHTDIV
jgi:hypothetical protein